MNPASWIIKERESGKVICETFDRRFVARLNEIKYEAVPIHEYLGSLNRREVNPPK